MRSIRTLAAVLLAAIVFASPVAAQSSAGDESGGGGRAPRERARIHTELGSLYFQEGNMAVALEELRIALAIDANYAPAYNVRGLLHYYLREFDEAERDFRRALRIAESDPEINNNYGWFLCQVKRESEALPYFLRAIKNPLYETPDRAYLNAGQCALKLGDEAAALDYLQKAVRLARTPSAPALHRLAEIALRQGRLDEARRQMTEALRAGEPSAEMLALAIRIERRVGDRAAEASLLSQLRKRFPDSREVQDLMKGNAE